jgi:hypothetical protein
MASSNTGPKPVWVNNFRGNLGRKRDRIIRPRDRIGVVGSSMRVRRGGMKRFQFWATISG